MPIYEYQCTGCNHHFDVIQKISDAPLTTCPRCQKDMATRLVSAAGFQLKGSGWYATDFKTKPSSTSGKPQSETESGAKDVVSTTESKGSDTA